jgi:hypothetical protein
MQIQPRLTDDERMNLVAFLDGELDDDALGQKLEEKVAQSVSVRREVQALEKTWGMLDWLPRPELPADFASQTVTRIHSQQLRAEMIEGHLKYWTLILARVIGWAACIAALLTAGFASVRYAWPDPTRELINHLDIAENLETYSAIPDLKFLDDIGRINMFRDPEAAPAEAPAGEAPADSATAAPGPGGQPATPAPM